MKTITQKCLRRAIAVSVGIAHFVFLFFWLNYVGRQHSEKTKTNAVWTTITIQAMISVLEPGLAKSHKVQTKSSTAIKMWKFLTWTKHITPKFTVLWLEVSVDHLDWGLIVKIIDAFNKKKKKNNTSKNNNNEWWVHLWCYYKFRNV